MKKLLKSPKNKIIILAVLTVILIILTFFVDAPYVFGVLSLIVAFDAKNIFKKTFDCIKNLKFESGFLRGIAVIILYFYTFVLILFPSYTNDVSRPVLLIGLALIILILEVLNFYKKNIIKKYENILDDIKNTENKYKIGDVIEIKSGEMIPADGIIIEGETLVNENLLTGNKNLVEKKFNDEVIGTSMNMKNRIVIKITQVGDDSVTSQIKSLVKDMGKEKSNSQIKTKKAEAVLGIIIFIISLGVMIFWLKYNGSIFIAIFSMCSILLIAAPENFYNAANIPIKFGINKSTKKGIYYKSGKIIDVLNKINRIIFKKRNVLTKGKLEITNIIPKEAFNEKRFLILLRSLESLSASPIAQAITEYCEKEKISFKKIHDYKIIKGMGIIGIVDNQEIIIGNEKLMEKYKVTMTNDLYHKAEVMAKNLRTPVFVARDRTLIGIVGITDRLKEEAKHGITSLKKMYKLSLITGDNKNVAEGICNEFGIKEYIADLDEIEKLEALRKYRENKDIVATVGDGKEDKDFLDEADVGIAVGTYTDILEKSNDVTLIDDDLKKLNQVMNYAKKIQAKSKQNFKYTFLYHLILIPIAGGLTLPLIKLIMHPAEASLLMILSFILIAKNSFNLELGK